LLRIQIRIAKRPGNPLAFGQLQLVTIEKLAVFR
jgi:hypothetical protein